MLHAVHLLLGESDGFLENCPDDRLQEGRGCQGALVVVKTLVLWQINSDITDSSDSYISDSDSCDSDGSESDSNGSNRSDSGVIRGTL